MLPENKKAGDSVCVAENCVWVTERCVWLVYTTADGRTTSSKHFCIAIIPSRWPKVIRFQCCHDCRYLTAHSHYCSVLIITVNDSFEPTRDKQACFQKKDNAMTISTIRMSYTFGKCWPTGRENNQCHNMQPIDVHRSGEWGGPSEVRLLF